MLSLLQLWAQTSPVPLPAAAGPARPLPDWLQWLYIWGEPSLTDARFIGGPITWLKVVGLFCLVAWVLSWVVTAFKTSARQSERKAGAIYFLVVAGLGLLGVLLQVLDQTGKLQLGFTRGTTRTTLGSLVLLANGIALVAGIELLVWSVVRRLGDRGDVGILVGMHLALLAGFAVSFLVRAYYGPGMGWRTALFIGGRIAATYMGLVVLAHVAARMLREVALLRWRRLYSVGWHTWVESTRRMWAPWVVLAVFVVILAFTHWFLKPGEGRDAELSRLFVGSLALLCSLLMTLMVMILSPISLPNDIRQQTIYTVVSKPVRRLELIWGRMLGFMGLVTVLLALFGAISLVYLERTVRSRITSDRTEADRVAATNPSLAKQLRDDAEQLETRMSARVPLRGSLIFFDSKGNERKLGIDVGQEMPTRSFIEGATPSKAVYRYGIVRDPFNPERVLDRRIPTDANGRVTLLRPGSIEDVEDHALSLIRKASMLQTRLREANLSAQDSKKISEEMAATSAEGSSIGEQLKQLKQKEADLRARAAALGAGAAPPGGASQTPSREGQQLLEQAQSMHSPDIPLEMTFNVYRTTKGVLGEPVLAYLSVVSGMPGAAPYRDLVAVHEYYTLKRQFPARLLVGGQGMLQIELRCESPNQYLGMSEPDVYVLAHRGGFQLNFLKGLFGVWLQAMVLTAIGVFAGTFLSWPVALLTTIAFFIAGNVAFNVLNQIALQSLVGGGPFESLIRLLSHENLVEDLAPTLGVVIAKTLDSIVMPFLSRLVYIVPNFGAMDVSNTVAEGFAVTGAQLRDLLLMGLGYAVPFSIAAYFVLKNREVAA